MLPPVGAAILFAHAVPNTATADPFHRRGADTPSCTYRRSLKFLQDTTDDASTASDIDEKFPPVE